MRYDVCTGAVEGYYAAPDVPAFPLELRTRAPNRHNSRIKAACNSGSELARRPSGYRGDTETGTEDSPELIQPRQPATAQTGQRRPFDASELRRYPNTR